MSFKKLLKKIYLFLPFKQPIFSVLKKVWVPPFFNHLHFKGVFKVRISDSESFRIKHYGYVLENEIFWKGIEGGGEKISGSLWMQLCRRSDVVMDIGANTGVYSLMAKAVNSSASVYAFEPVRRVYEKLVINNKLNGYDIACCNYAVSSFTGEATIYDSREEHIYSVTVNKNLSPQSATVPTKIRTITLNDFIEQHAIANIDLMKIDVETHEPEVLQGFDKYLKKFRPAIIIEILNDEIGAKVETIVKDEDYLYFNIDENRGIRQVEKITKSDYFNFLLCSRKVAAQLNLVYS